VETDTEYILSDHFDPEKAKSMGFDLFLAKLECEYLLELMNQRSHLECLDILRSRASPLTFSAGKEVSEPINDICNLNEDAFKDDGHVEGGSLVNPGEQQQQESLKSHEPHNQEVNKSLNSTISDVERPPSSFMTDDKSILEMRESYPDLAIRQKPIFPKSQRMMQPLKAQEKAGCRGHNAALFHEVSTDMSGPQSIAIHNEATPGHRKQHIPNPLVEAQALDDNFKSTSRQLQVETLLQGRNREGSTEDCLLDLTEQMGKMHMKDLTADEPLKYPIEETAQTQPSSGHNDVITTPPTKHSDGLSLPILCSPSQEPVCNIAGCGSCAGSDAVLTQDGTIKEPPQSIYIPSALNECTTVFGPPTDHSQTANEGASAHKSPISQQPEDELDQTYVMV